MHKVLWPRGQYLHFSDHSLYLLWLTFYHLHKLSLSLCHTKYDKYLSQIWNEERKKQGKIIWDNRITRKQHWYKEYCTFFIFFFVFLSFAQKQVWRMPQSVFKVSQKCPQYKMTYYNAPNTPRWMLDTCLWSVPRVSASPKCLTWIVHPSRRVCFLASSSNRNHFTCKKMEDGDNSTLN